MLHVQVPRDRIQLVIECGLLHLASGHLGRYSTLSQRLGSVHTSQCTNTCSLPQPKSDESEDSVEYLTSTALLRPLRITILATTPNER
jgi:hypothetical protein